MPDRPPQTVARRDARAGDDELGPEEPSGVHPASRDFAREVARSGLWKVAVGVGAFAVVCFLGGVTVSKVMAQGAKDAAVAVAADVKRQADATSEEMKRMQAEFTEHVQVESAARVRLEKKINALLDHEGVKDPAPTPKDGGR